jgi:hypothetical protein
VTWIVDVIEAAIVAAARMRLLRERLGVCRESFSPTRRIMLKYVIEKGDA